MNYIKSHLLNSRLYGIICEEMGSGHKQLLILCEVLWLSRGRVLNRLFELKDEVKLFLFYSNFDLKDWILKLISMILGMIMPC